MRVTSKFADRADAGRQLAASLEWRGGAETVVVAMPPGGVLVAFEIARNLGARLDVVLVERLRAPGGGGPSIGAVIGGERPEVVLDPEVVRALGVSGSWIRSETARSIEDVRSGEERLRLGEAPVPIAGRRVILVDDGGSSADSVRAAIRGLRREGPTEVLVALPVAATSTLAAIRPEADDLVCLEAATDPHSIGLYYASFEPVGEDEARRLLEESRRLAEV